MWKGLLQHTTINRSYFRIKIRLTFGLRKIWGRLRTIANLYPLPIGMESMSLLMQQLYFTEMIPFETVQCPVRNFPQPIWQRLPKRVISYFMKLAIVHLG